MKLKFNIKIYFITAITAFAPVLTACTSAMWDDTKYSHTGTSSDTIKSMLMSEDGHMIILGERYHYIFDPKHANNYQTVKRMVDKLRPHYTADFHNCSVNRIHNEVKCEVGLAIESSELSESEIRHARELGFFPKGSPYLNLDVSKNMASKIQSKSIWIAESKVVGDLFQGDEKITAAAQQLNQNYIINFQETKYLRDPGKTAVAIAATPITLIGDGVLFLGAAAIYAMPGETKWRLF